MKRIFISVGSAGLSALSELIDRLRMENLFNRFDDYYIALDSMQKEVDKFNSISVLMKTERVKGFLVSANDQDKEAILAFARPWAEDIPGGEVGGDRRVCAKAVSSIKNVLHNSDLRLFADLQPDDQIIVVGSAFGGTSSGMFLNVCEYLDLMIRRKRLEMENEEYKTVQVLGFLLMPEGEISEGGDYPIPLNMIDMFRDIQTVSWRRRLESTRSGFKVPTLAHYENGYFSLFTKSNAGQAELLQYGISGSSLPMGTLYLVPTPQKKRSILPSLFAETLFVASYLRVDRGHSSWVDRVRGGGTCPEIYLTAEDKCLAGFNMFVMKSGRMLSLKNWFNKGILSAYATLKDDSGPNETVRNHIVSFFKKVQMPCLSEPYAGVKHEKLDELTTAFFLDMDRFREFRDGTDRLLEEIQLKASSINGISPYGLVAILGSLDTESAWIRQVTFSSIKNAYSDYYGFLETEERKREEYAHAIEKKVKDTLDRIKHRTKCLFGFGKWKQNRANTVRARIVDAFLPELKDLFAKYCFACRVRKTISCEPAVFDSAIDTIDQYMEEVSCIAKHGLDMLNQDNPFVKEGVLVDPLVLPEEKAAEVDFNPLKILVSAAFRSKFRLGDSENTVVLKRIKDMNNTNRFLADLATSRNIMEEAEETAISSFNNAVNDLPPESNPLAAATVSNFDAFNAKTFLPAFSVPDSGRFHYHFSIKLNVPDDFRLSNGDVAGGSGLPSLGLATMSNIANPTEPFLTTNHADTADGAYWKDENTDETPIPEPIKQNMQGLWIGTLGINFSVNYLINKIYGSYNDVKNDWLRVANTHIVPRNLMSTIEMVQFGILMEAIEAKIQEKWREYDENNNGARIMSFSTPVTITFRKERGTGASMSLPSGRLFELGFVDSGTQGCCMGRISFEWTKTILQWIRNMGPDGFNSFYPADFQTINNTQTNIFEGIRFSIRQGEIDEMDRLKQLILESMAIEGFEEEDRLKS